MRHQQRIRSADLRLAARTTVFFLGRRVGVGTEYVITRQVPVQRRRRGRLRRQLHAVRTRRCARRLAACGPPTWLAVVVKNCYIAIRSARIFLIFVCRCCTIKFFTMIWNLLLMVSRIKPVTSPDLFTKIKNWLTYKQDNNKLEAKHDKKWQ